MTDQIELNLLPCPLIGKEARVYQDCSSDDKRHWSWGVEATYGDQYLSLSGFKTEEEAVAFWNQRAALPKAEAAQEDDIKEFKINSDALRVAQNRYNEVVVNSVHDALREAIEAYHRPSGSEKE